MTREVKRLVASPTPLGAQGMLGDAVSWRVDVPEGVVVCVSAREGGGAPFYLHATDGHTKLGSPTPGMAQGFTLPGPASWTLTIDPAFGALADILVDLSGHYVDCPNAPASFSLVDLPSPPPCLTEAGACLP
jgi:hypothetical protein